MIKYENKIIHAYESVMKDIDKLPEWFKECYGLYEDFKTQVLEDIDNDNLDPELPEKEFIKQIKSNIADGIRSSNRTRNVVARAKYIEQRDGYH